MENTIKIIMYANIVPILSCFFLLALVSYHPTQNKNQTRMFQIAAIIEIIMILIISIDYLISRIYTPEMYMFKRFTSFCNFVVSPLIPLLLFKIFHPSPINKWLYLPLCVNFILCFISIFNGMIFYIDPMNDYYRGSLYIIPFLTMLFYMFNLIFLNEAHYKQDKKIERIFLISAVALFVFGMFLEIVYNFSFLTWDFSSLCLFAYYLLLCIHSAILDPLTGAFNRIKYNKMLSVYEHRKSFTIAMLDINDFKLVNDTQGHDAGDQVLISFVDLLEHHLNKEAYIYRVGGDEFILLSRKLDEKTLEDKIISLKLLASEQHVEFAYGICTYMPTDNLTSVIEQADKNMYDNKALSKGKLK